MLRLFVGLDSAFGTILCVSSVRRMLRPGNTRGGGGDQPYTHAEFEFGSRGAIALVIHQGFRWENT